MYSQHIRYGMSVCVCVCVCYLKHLAYIFSDILYIVHIFINIKFASVPGITDGQDLDFQIESVFFCVCLILLHD